MNMGKMKFVIVFGAIILLLYICVRYFDYLMNQPCDPPARPSKVSANAKWFGGCDGGDWIELVKCEENRYRFRIYRDWDGVLNMDADFVPENCDKLQLTSKNWEGLISHYTRGDSVVYIEVKNEKNCRLKFVYPAYDGDDWKGLQEKKQLK
jgi:hypothetical protein